MTVSTSASEIFVGRPGLFKSRGLQNAVLGMFAVVVSAGATVWVVVTVSDQNDREAARMIVDGQKGGGYLAKVVTAMAAQQGRPRGQ